MKKVVPVLLAIFLSLSLVSALDITLTKSSYYPGETLQAEFPVSPFVDALTAGSIGIYKGDSVHKTPVQSGFIKSENKYLYYAVLPEGALSEGEYSLKIENANHYENSVLTEDTIEKTFTITQTNSSYLSFNPGNIYASSNFSINIKAYNADQSISVDFPEANFKQTFSLGYGLDKTVYIPISSVNGTVKSNIKINSYTIPAIVIGKAQTPSGGDGTTKPAATGEENFSDLLSLHPDKIIANVYSDIDFSYKIILRRETSATLENIEVSSSDDQIEVKNTSINLADDEETLEIIINSDKDLKGTVTLKYNDEELKIPVDISLAQTESDIFAGTPSVGETETCTQMGGVICNDTIGEICSGSRTRASDGTCCKGGECQVPASSSGWIWGILILIILGAGGWFLYRKAKGGKGAAPLGNIFKKKTEAYEKRIMPEMDKSLEVRKSLAKN